MPTADAGSDKDRNSISAFERAKSVFPDGTTRATVERSPYPRYLASGDGAYVIDIDGRRFLDLNNNFTTLIHGHGFGPVTEAIQAQLRAGTCFANPTEAEIALADLICDRVPGLDRIRFVNTGTEAVMFAIKAARAFTGRPKIAKIEGAYHGAYDWAEVSQFTHPGVWGMPNTPASVPYYDGMPASVLDETVVLRFNDVAGATHLLSENADKLACLLIDPMPSRAGLIPPEPTFLDAVSEVCRERGILIIADEVLNFRQSYQGASHRHGLVPDLFALGKIIGGGLPIGAVGGCADIMGVFDGSGGRAKLPQGGTFSANPLSMVAGAAAMQALTPDTIEHLEWLGDRARRALTSVANERSAPFCVTGVGSLFRIHPHRVPPREFRQTVNSASAQKVMSQLTDHFLEAGILLPKGAAACLSTPMTEADVDRIGEAFDSFLEKSATLVRCLNEEAA